MTQILHLVNLLPSRKNWHLIIIRVTFIEICMSHTVIATLSILIHLTLITKLLERHYYYYSHSTDRKTI